MVAVLKIIHVFLLASVKYALTFPYALLIGLNYEQTMLAVTLGGIAGFFFFYYLSGFIIRLYKKYYPIICSYAPEFFQKRYQHWCTIKKEHKQRRGNVFSKRSRFMVNFRKQYGLLGIIIASPILLSIPVGAFLLKRYYSKNRFAMSYMVISILSWTAVFTALALIFPNLIR